MGWENRHYNQYGQQGGFGGGGGSLGGRLSGASVVLWLLGINAIVFVLDGVLTGSRRADALAPSYWGYFSVVKAVYGLQVWRWVTYQFLHADFFHIVFNMIGLYFFGPMMERYWGSRRFLLFYLACGLGGALLYVVLSFVPGVLSEAPGNGVLTGQHYVGLVGASGCIFGILVACAAVYPNHQVMLMFPPIPMRMRTMAAVFVGIAMLALISGSHNAGGEAAHLGGAAIGWLLIRKPSWLDFADRFSAEKLQKSRRDKQNRQTQREDAEIDRILDKVRDKGLASLSSREKKLLQKATDRQRRAG